MLFSSESPPATVHGFVTVRFAPSSALALEQLLISTAQRFHVCGRAQYTAHTVYSIQATVHACGKLNESEFEWPVAH
jgi:hypothetical protein